MDYLKVAIVLTALESATFTMIAFVKYHALTNDVPRPLAYAMVSPSFIVAVVLFVKAITLCVIPDVARSIFFRAQFDSIEVLWIYLVMFLLINVSAIASALMKLIFKIRDLAIRDQLTNLFNRRAIVRELAAAQRIYRREHIPFCVLLIDIDKFKNINDQYGHDVGDAAIKFVAERMQKQLRETDKLARYGGEEFLALLLNCELTTAHTVAEKLCSALELAPFEYQGNAIPITISVGVCAIDKANDVKTLIAMADKALYQAKHEGRNRTVDAAPIQP
jgi:diguanylate cyclase (GGDEF)-like protein